MNPTAQGDAAAAVALKGSRWGLALHRARHYGLVLALNRSLDSVPHLIPCDVHPQWCPGCWLLPTMLLLLLPLLLLLVLLLQLLLLPPAAPDQLQRTRKSLQMRALCMPW
jgi:hypothetical protein